MAPRLGIQVGHNGRMAKAHDLKGGRGRVQVEPREVLTYTIPAEVTELGALRHRVGHAI